MPTMPKMTGMDQNFHYANIYKLTPNAQFSHKDVLNTRNAHALSFLNGNKECRFFKKECRF